MHRPNLAALVLCAWIAAAVATTAHAGAPLVYLSWGAPWGQPGARENLRVTGDSTRVDTLYLSFDPGSDAAGFAAVDAVLYFWPQSGDTLGAFWHFERTAENPMSCRIDFDVSPYEAMSPWMSSGMGMPRYEHTRGSGRLSFVYAVPANAGMALKAGTLYCVARVFISHRRAHLSGSRQPLCIEWRDADLTLTADSSSGPPGGGSPAVSWNSPGGKACKDFNRNRGAAAPVDTAGSWSGVPGAARPASGPTRKR